MSIQFIISIILVFCLEFKIEGLIYAILISNLIILCYLFIFMINNKKSFDLRILKKALIFSYPLLLTKPFLIQSDLVLMISSF